MKKLKMCLGLVTVIAAFMLTACDETTHNLPVITIDNANPIVLRAGEDTTTIRGDIVAEAGLSQVKVIKITGLTELQIGNYTSFSADPFTSDDDVNYTINLKLSDITESITIKIEATDKDDQYVSQSIEITATALFEQSNLTLNAQANGPMSADANESFLATANGESYTLNEVDGNTGIASTIDIMFMRHSQLKAGEPHFSLRSPDEQGIADYFAAILLDYPASSGMNSTKLKMVIDAVNWNDLSADDFANATSNVDSGSDRVDNLDDGDIVAFKTAAGKKGLIRVVQIVDPGNVSERYMKSNIIIDYKVEQ